MFAQLRQFWMNLSTVAKVAYGFAAVLLVTAVTGVGYWSTQEQYAILFAKLPPEDASAIVEKLKADQISHKLSLDGTTISVPVDKVPGTRMNMIAAGLPQSGGKGWELFDSMSMGTTPFVQEMNYNRAMQGELQRSIMKLDPVAEARVHITQPDKTPFVRDEKPVTASIVIKTKPGMVLNRAATNAIVKLTAGSVKGLTADNVTVVDTEGRVLSETRDARGGMASGDQLAYQREVESHLADNAQDILTRLLGPGRAVVRVTADMSFRHLKEFSEKFDPEGKVVHRQSVMSSKISPAGAGKGGPVGAASNIPGQQTNGGPNGNGASNGNGGPNKNDETIESEYLVSRTNLEKLEQQGLIDRLTIAVILIPPKGDGDAPEDVLGITPDEAKELVKQAVGYKEGRDQIQVSIGKGVGEPAAGPEAVALQGDAVAAVPLVSEEYISIVRYSSLGLATLIAIAIAAKMIRRRSAKLSSAAPAFAGMSADPQHTPEELADLHAVAATIKAWLEEPNVIRFESTSPGATPQAKSA